MSYRFYIVRKPNDLSEISQTHKQEKALEVSGATEQIKADVREHVHSQTRKREKNQQAQCLRNPRTRTSRYVYLTCFNLSLIIVADQSERLLGVSSWGQQTLPRDRPAHREREREATTISFTNSTQSSNTGVYDRESIAC